jgi:hypothetical protein
MKSALIQFASVWVVPFLLVGCSAPEAPVAQLTPAHQPSVKPLVQPVEQPVEQPSVTQSSESQVTEAPQPAPAQLSPATVNRSTRVARIQVQRDYDFRTPLPSTGQVTIRGSIRTIQLDQLIADCPTDSAPYALAESTNYRVQVCSEEYDPWLPKYYIGQAKDGSGELRITSTDVNAARQLIFENAGYTYVIYRDGARPNQINAYLEVYSPSGQGYAEALWYLYEAEGP